MRVRVSPAHEFQRRRRLFSALAAVFPAEFATEGSNEAVDGWIDFACDGGPAAPSDVRRLGFLPVDGREPPDAAGGVHFSDSALLDPRLRGRSIEGPLVVRRGSHRSSERGEVLAYRDQTVLWWARVPGGRRADLVAAPPSELPPRESLREMCRSQPAALIPLIQFLRDLTGYAHWRRPPLRAAFVIDDPNVHWPTYGYLDYAALAAHAREHAYHVVLATIPIDTWYTHEGAAALLRRSPSELSLTVHGHEHRRRELERLGSTAEATASLRTALARIERLERRARLTVSRVMVPPHGVCADHVYPVLIATGFEALCREPAWWRDRTEALQAVGGWGIADVSHAGLPVLARHSLTRASTPDELQVAAFLDQPMLAFCHSTDLAGGYERLAEVAAGVNGIGPVRWAGLGEIARSNYLTRVDGDERLTVRMFTRRALVPVPEAVTHVAVERPRLSAPAGERVVYNGRRFPLTRTSDGATSEPIPVSGGRPVDIRQETPIGTDVRPNRRRRPAGHIIARRVATEARDRLEPVASRGALARTLRRVKRAAGG
jgi:hypothetical protein